MREPERYYDWILWKPRQKQKWTEKMNDKYIYESPDKGKTVYKRKMDDHLSDGFHHPCRRDMDGHLHLQRNRNGRLHL